MTSLIRIYDIDGTITMPGFDLWHLITRNLAEDTQAFDNAVNEWKARMSQDGCPYAESREMMKTGLRLMKSNLGYAEVYEEARKITSDILHKIFPGAIEHVKTSIHSGFQVVFATTNYLAGGKGFISALSREGWLDNAEATSIIVSGSNVNWETRDVIHFNMGKGKATGICSVLGYSYDKLKEMIESSYGDDPSGNDREILRIAPKAYVIWNDKNRHAKLLPNMQFANWDFINAQATTFNG
ncbi:MAG TPA: hypothetical protein P5032_11625 [Candidatus Competibacter sp.]|nr:hypothetical protein [Candidatus Competibacter sp.]